MNLIGDFFNLIFTYPIFNALMLLYHLVGDFGLAIIVLTIGIYLLLLPLTRRQLKSMKAMMALQPELTEIRKQHAKDLRAQSEATQVLYKKHGITPISPYLPLLIQAPVFGGLYAALNIVLNHTKLAQLNAIIYPFWPHLTSLPNIDLNWFTVFNAAWHISLGLPDPSHILPILAGAVTFVQMRMAQPNAIAETKEAMTHLTQVMQFILPLLMVFFTIFIAWHFAAGLALYRAASLLLNMIQQYFVSGWGSLLKVPNFASVATYGVIKSNGSDANSESRQQTQPRSKSSARGNMHRMHRKGAATLRRGKNSKKNRRHE